MIRDTTPQDIVKLAATMRQADVRECRLVGGVSPIEALAFGLMHSKPCVTLLDDNGGVVCVAGVTPINHRDGAIWMLSSPLINSNVKERLRVGREWLDGLAPMYDRLSNCVLADNNVHIRLIKAMGFTLFADQKLKLTSGGETIMFERIL